MSAVLDVRGLRVAIDGTPLVTDVDLHVDAGECVALVGASGSGKSVTVRALLGLSAAGAAVRADRLEVAGLDARAFSERRWRSVRGARVGYVGQEALGALDPLRPVGREIGDVLRLHTEMRAHERVDAVRSALADVGLDPAIASDGRLAGTLSGGMRQRALIAAATIGSPVLVVADEPTTALDAGVAVRVMDQLRRAQSRGAGLLVVTHDLGLVAGWADRVVVVDDGRVVEQGPVSAVLRAPSHPVTRALVAAAGAGSGAGAGAGSYGPTSTVRTRTRTQPRTVRGLPTRPPLRARFRTPWQGPTLAPWTQPRTQTQPRTVRGRGRSTAQPRTVRGRCSGPTTCTRPTTGSRSSRGCRSTSAPGGCSVSSGPRARGRPPSPGCCWASRPRTPAP